MGAAGAGLDAEEDDDAAEAAAAACSDDALEEELLLLEEGRGGGLGGGKAGFQALSRRSNMSLNSGFFFVSSFLSASCWARSIDAGALPVILFIGCASSSAGIWFLV